MLKIKKYLFLRKQALIFPITFALLGPAFLQAQSNELFRSWNQPIEPFRIIANIYYVGANEIASYLITGREGHVIIDGGFAETAEIIRNNVEKLGFELTDVKILLNSHAHLDHAGGLADLKKRTGAELMVMSGDVETIETGNSNDLPGFHFPAVKVDRIMGDKGQVILGDITLIAHRTPGHTRGNTTWSMQVNDAEKTYNVLFVGSPNVLPEVALVENADYPQIAEDYKKTFRVLRNLPCDIFLSAHGSFFFLERKVMQLKEGVTENPFIDPEHYSHFVDRKEKIFLQRLNEQLSKVKR